MKVFTKEWELFGDWEDNKVKDYFEYQKNFLPKWYNEFSVHDNQIKNVIKSDKLIILDSIYDDCISTKYKFKLYDPVVIEDCEMKNAWCLRDELYITDGGYEYYLMVNDFYDNSIVSYFTCKCSNVELVIGNKIFSTGGESHGESLQAAFGDYPPEDELLEMLNKKISLNDESSAVCQTLI